MTPVRPWLYIRDLSETQDASLLRHVGIGAMLQLSRESPQEGIPHLFLPVEDGMPLSAEHLDAGVRYVLERRDEGRVVFVSCAQGVSRSATFVTAALLRAEGLPLREAFAAVVGAHPVAMPHPALWQSLCA